MSAPSFPYSLCGEDKAVAGAFILSVYLPASIKPVALDDGIESEDDESSEERHPENSKPTSTFDSDKFFFRDRFQNTPHMKKGGKWRIHGS